MQPVNSRGEKHSLFRQKMQNIVLFETGPEGPELEDFLGAIWLGSGTFFLFFYPIIFSQLL